MTIDDIDIVEINEAFASVVLAWQRELEPDLETRQPQRRRHRPRPPARRHRRASSSPRPCTSCSGPTRAPPSSPCAAVAASAPAPSSSASERSRSPVAPASRGAPAGVRPRSSRSRPSEECSTWRRHPCLHAARSPTLVRRRRPVLSSLLVLAAGASVVPAVRRPRSSRASDRVAVTRVVDGDTIVVDRGGDAEERVRLIGIDTPETKKPDRRCSASARRPRPAPPSCCRRAHAVRLERDVEERDRYGRLLAYVYRDGDGLFVNLALVTRRLRRPATRSRRTSPTSASSAGRPRGPPAGRGLWQACGSATAMWRGAGRRPEHGRRR